MPALAIRPPSRQDGRTPRSARTGKARRVSVWGLDLKGVALWAWMPFVAADLGSLYAGLRPPLPMRRGAGVIASRTITMSFGAQSMVGPACIGLAGSPGVATALFSFVGLAYQVLNGALITRCSVIFDSRMVGTASGMAILWTLLRSAAPPKD
ncbi:hypothetical protein HT136_20245 [Novosphingobium profundi]|uniref:hypothetical protein n=1 Tax=Novosphingobium profundi TaxID=1774954 RepID=UPI001BDA629B|nr:hypothetical protein [Novosphingobium profundi]MBT0670702.1 hypothetical protein [Novosphingobium profundi]